MITRNIGNTDVPALGFGTFRLTGKACKEAIQSAIATGYRHIDTAQMYDNETEVGEAIKQSGVVRDALFVTTKIWYSELTPARMQESTKVSLKKLKMDYVDMLLIHWPTPNMDLNACLDTLAELKAKKLAKYVGVCNFSRKILKAAIASHPGLISNHQFEYHPFLNQDSNRALCNAANIMATAYCPLAQGRVASNATLTQIGKHYNKSASQVALRWLLQQDGVMAIPKASQAKNMQANMEIFGFELSAEDMKSISALNSNTRLVNPGFAPDWNAE